MAPSFEFPAPVLCVATDVVRQLEGGDALTGLWTLFTKCKASLEDGHRLENISWRLWHRELAATTPRPGRVSDSEHSGDGNQMLDAKTAIGYEQGGNFPKTEHLPSTHVPLPPYPIHSSVPRAHLQSPMVTTAGSLTRCNGNSFGKIIIDMLPNPLPSATPHPCKDPAQTGSPLTSSVSPQSTAPAPTADTHSLPIHCHLPTPAAYEHYLMPPSTVPAQTSPEAVPLFQVQVQVQVDPAPPSNPPPPLPQLIIVHPTPGPTPHPTPPASPILAFGASSGTSKAIDAPFPVAAAAEQLASPKFTLHADSSTTSSSSDSSSTSGRTTTLSLSATTISVNEESEAVAPPQTKHAASTAVAVSLANASRASSTHVVAPPPLSGTTTTVLTKPTPTPTAAASVVKKAHSSPTVRPSPAPAPAAAAAADAEHSRARPRAPGSLRQASSASSVVGSSKGGDERSKSKSRSRSRGRADGPGRAGLMMTAAGGKRGPAMAAAGAGGAQRGRAVGLRKSVSGKGGGSMGRAVVRDKKPTFNIGSNSDGGSKSVGSGSSVSNTVNVDVDVDGARREEEGKMGKTKTSVGAPQRQQSASKLMPPPLRHLLPDPATVLPSRQQQPRRTIVLATSDSDDDYETESDVTESDSEHGGDGAQRVEVEEEGDNADWSSEDMSNDDVEFVRRGGGTQPRSGGHDKKGHVQPQHRSNSTANIPSTHHNHNHNHNHNHANSNSTINNNRQRGAAHPHHLSRAQQSRRNHAANAQYVVEQAALEAERIRDMFAKKPVPSSEDLVKQRTNSVGLLTQLMHPDPEIFPPSHPYHRGHSSGDVKGTPRGLGLLGGGLEMTRANSNANANVNAKVNGNEVGARAAAAAAAVGQGQAGARGKKPGVQPPQRRASAGPVPGINLRKSAVATPVASQVQVGSVSSVSREPGEESARADDGEKSRRRGGVNGVYRPKGRPADQEMEDTESEGENGDAANEILVSKSVAQEKLKALAARKGIILNQRREEEEEEEGGDPMPSWARESALEAKGRRRTSSNHPSHGDAPMSRQQQQSQVPVPTPTPIPLGHPYNLPPAAPPSTPRTTRRLMLQTEMSESLRRNLLWERQVSKVNLVVRRSSSGSGSSRNGTVLGGAPLRPLTGLPSLVQLTAKQPGSGTGSGSNTPSRERGAASEEQDREERKMRALARTRSWANEFHYTGW